MMTLTQAIAGLVVSLLSARLLGPAGRGAFSLGLLIVGTAGFIANPCIYAAANYFLSSKKMSLDRMMPLVILFGGLSAILGSVLAYFGSVWWADGLSVLGQQTLIVISVGAGAFSLSTTMNGVLYGSKRVGMIAGWSIISALIYAGLILYLTQLPEPSVAHFANVYVLTLALDAGVKLVMGGWGSWQHLVWDSQYVQSFLQYGFSVYIGRVLMLFSQKIDTYLLYLFAGQVALGYYSIAASFGEQLWMFPAAVNLVMMANIAARQDDEAAEMTISASQIVFTLATFGALGLGGVGFWLIPFLYGAEFQPSVLPFLIMLPGIIAISSYMLIEPYFQSRGKPMIPVRITFMSAGANLVISLILVPLFGMRGAALGYTLSYFFQLGLTGYYFNQMTGRNMMKIFDITEPILTAVSYAKMTFYSNMEKQIGTPS